MVKMIRCFVTFVRIHPLLGFNRTHTHIPISPLKPIIIVFCTRLTSKWRSITLWILYTCIIFIYMYLHKDYHIGLSYSWCHVFRIHHLSDYSSIFLLIILVFCCSLLFLTGVTFEIFSKWHKKRWENQFNFTVMLK